MLMEWLKLGMGLVNLTATTSPKMDLQCPKLNFMFLGNMKVVFMAMGAPPQPIGSRKMAAGRAMVSIITETMKAMKRRMAMEYAINEMVRSQPHRRGNHSGHGNGFITTQSYGPCKTMGLEYTEAEYSETHFSNDSHYYGGGRGYRGNGHSAKGLMNNNSGENSCSDSQSNDENDHHGGFNKVWKCKEIR
ncbi:uncharacterized protein LOC120117238 [Hibiscus syriacus]|uniref:uncharacterized protein LOC120117238 n=1 Tax=Hibiscus syriacus TaxID=106335 RepID=UPI00192077D9|nr:uncharacterized protein LOC120117238 [Hibiscus syriacus]